LAERDLMTGLGAVFNAAGGTPGSTVAVIGCGGVGLSVIQVGGVVTHCIAAHLPPSESGFSALKV
jgi:S-(hydroxymethyl)glutathione dehydrogenase/alcohol dehydrogenase